MFHLNVSDVMWILNGNCHKMAPQKEVKRETWWKLNFISLKRSKKKFCSEKRAHFLFSSFSKFKWGKTHPDIVCEWWGSLLQHNTFPNNKVEKQQREWRIALRGFEIWESTPNRRYCWECIYCYHSYKRLFMKDSSLNKFSLKWMLKEYAFNLYFRDEAKISLFRVNSSHTLSLLSFFFVSENFLVMLLISHQQFLMLLHCNLFYCAVSYTLSCSI